MATFHLRWPDPDEMSRYGFDSLRDIPCVFDGDEKYHDEASWYLRERALKEWCPELQGPMPFPPSYPTKRSMATYGHALVNFLEWASDSMRDWRKIEYTQDIVLGYEAMMLDGRWSARNLPLADNTVDQRRNEARSFLSWAAGKSLRPKFDGLTDTARARSSKKPGRKQVKNERLEKRSGRVRPAVTDLYMPAESKVEKWLASAYARSGTTKGLMCETIIGSGLRREELIQLRTTSIPATETVLGLPDDAQVQIHITFGAKGSKPITDQSRGPPREIFIDAALANKLCAYRDGLRNDSLAAYVRKGDSPSARRRRIKSHGNRLFISEYTGIPVTAERLYEAWVEAPHSPFLGWSPHPGRHYWACHKLLQLMRKERWISKASAKRDPQGFDVTARNLLQIVIQPQLGHVDEKTTLLYLRWLRMSFLATGLADDWNSAMDDE